MGAAVELVASLIRGCWSSIMWAGEERKSAGNGPAELFFGRYSTVKRTAISSAFSALTVIGYMAEGKINVNLIKVFQGVRHDRLRGLWNGWASVSYTHLRAHETPEHL